MVARKNYSGPKVGVAEHSEIALDWEVTQNLEFLALLGNIYRVWCHHEHNCSFVSSGSWMTIQNVIQLISGKNLNIEKF